MKNFNLAQNFKKIVTSVGIFLTVFISPSSALAATLMLNPNTGTLNKGCTYQIKIDLDTSGSQTDAAEAVLSYDATRLTATKITNGTIYPDYPGNSIDTRTGKINVTGLASVEQAFSSTGTLGTIDFQVNSAAPTGQTTIKFDFDPNNKSKTTDSNVIERDSLFDRLDSVTDGVYQIGSGSCPANGLPTQGGTTGSTNLAAQGGGATDSSLPKQLPDTAITSPTLILSIVGGVLVALGIIGLILL